MKTRLLSAVAAAAALVAVPTMAQADTARLAAPVSDESAFGGEGFGINSIGFLAAAAAIVVGTIIVVADDDDDDEPVSA